MKTIYVITVLVFTVALVGLGIWGVTDSRGQDVRISDIATADDIRIQTLTADIEDIGRRLAALEGLSGQVPDRASVTVPDTAPSTPIDYREYVRWSDDTQDAHTWDFERGRIDGVGTINPINYNTQYWSPEDDTQIAIRVAVEIDIDEDSPGALLDTTQWYLVTQPHPDTDAEYPLYFTTVLEDVSHTHHSTATHCVEKAYVRHDYKCGLIFRVPPAWLEVDDDGDFIYDLDDIDSQLVFLYRTSEGVRSLNWYADYFD